MLTYPHIDPVILNLWGPFALRWYGLAYFAAVMFGYLYLPFVARLNQAPFSKKVLHDAVFQALAWAVLGGRLGYVLFYEPLRLWHDPLFVARLWEGGMSFHGGIIGVGLGLYLLTRRHRLPLVQLTDLLSLAVPFGIFCGRIANFINAELYGRITTSAWGMVFPNGGPYPRHPSQLYEAFGEGVVLFIALNMLNRFSDARHHQGALTGVFMMGYGIIRYGVEFFREPSVLYAWLPDWMTLGQLLSLPLICLGAGLIVKSRWGRGALVS